MSKNAKALRKRCTFTGVYYSGCGGAKIVLAVSKLPSHASVPHRLRGFPRLDRDEAPLQIPVPCGVATRLHPHATNTACGTVCRSN